MPLDAAIKPPAKPRALKPAKLTAAQRAQRATEKTAAIASAFGEIGRTNGTRMPESTNPDDKYWWARLVSQQLGTLNDKAKDDSNKALIARGLLPNYAEHPLPIGTSATIYASDLLTAAVKVTQQADRVDVAALVAELVAKELIKPGVLKRLVKKHTRSFAGAHSVTALLTG